MENERGECSSGIDRRVSISQQKNSRQEWAKRIVLTPKRLDKMLTTVTFIDHMDIGQFAVNSNNQNDPTKAYEENWYVK